MIGRISQALKKKRRKKDKDGRELTIWLSPDAVQRMERLRVMFKRLDDSELITFSLKSLEHRMNKFVKRLVLRKIRALEMEEWPRQQSADHLNKQRVLGPGKAKKWNAGSIARFSEENQEGIANQNRK